MNGILLGAGCTLLTASTTIAPSDGGGWTEVTTWEVDDAGGCRAIDVPLAEGVRLGAHTAKLRLSDDTKIKVGDERWVVAARGLDDVGKVSLLVPDLLPGDHAVLTVTREWTADAPFLWTPGADGAKFAEIAWTPGAAPRSKAAGLHYEGDGAWAQDPTADVSLSIARPGWALSAPSLPAVDKAGMSAVDALTLASSRILLLPRGVDGNAPVAGQPALDRGAADDRGFARTVAALAKGGPDRVEVGWYVYEPAKDGAPPRALAEVALLVGDTVTPLWPSALAVPSGWVLGPSGVVAASSPPAAPSPPAEPAPAVRVERKLTLQVGGGDPQARLFPGGGSSSRDERKIVLAPETSARTWVVPLPANHGAVDATIAPEGTASTIRVRDDAVVVVAAPGEEPTTVTVGWSTPDAPACGEIESEPGEDLKVDVVDPDGRVERTGPYWWLSSHGGVPVVPDRESVVRALDYRFRSVSIPEPGVPMSLRGMPRGADLAAALKDALFQRVRVVPLAKDALWPRKLVKARKSGVLDPVEGALVLWLYASQEHIPATWALARPASLGAGHPVCAVGYDEGLVHVTVDDQDRWMDPGCRACAPFEIRPDLEGAALFGPIEDPPPTTPGEDVVRVEDDGVHEDLSGPAALLLRLAIADVPPGDRERWLAEHVGGPGAKLVSADGVGDAGKPVHVVVSGGSVYRDPLALPPARADGSRWLVWTGTRRLERPARPDDVAGDREAGGVVFHRAVDGGRLVDTIDVRDRRLNADDAAAIEGARSAHRE